MSILPGLSILFPQITFVSVVLPLAEQCHGKCSCVDKWALLQNSLKNMIYLLRPRHLKYSCREKVPNCFRCLLDCLLSPASIMHLPNNWIPQSSIFTSLATISPKTRNPNLRTIWCNYCNSISEHSSSEYASGNPQVESMCKSCAWRSLPSLKFYLLYGRHYIGKFNSKGQTFLSLIVPLSKTIFRIIMIVKILIFQISKKRNRGFYV